MNVEFDGSWRAAAKQHERDSIDASISLAVVPERISSAARPSGRYIPRTRDFGMPILPAVFHRLVVCTAYTDLRMEALASEFRPERVETRTVYVQGTVIQVSVVKDPLSLSITYFVQMGSTCENRIIPCQL